MATKPIQNVRKAVLWVKAHGGTVAGQSKPGRGKPTANWQILSATLDDVPRGEPWLLRAKDGQTMRVLFPDPDSDKPSAAPAAPSSSAAPAAPAEIQMPVGEVLTAIRNIGSALSQVGQGMTNAQMAVNQSRESERQSLSKAKEVVDSDNAVSASAVQWTGIAFVAERFCNTLELMVTRKVVSAEDLPDYLDFKRWQARRKAKKAISAVLMQTQSDAADETAENAGTAA